MAERTDRRKPSDNSNGIADNAPGRQRNNISAPAAPAVSARQKFEEVAPLAPDLPNLADNYDDEASPQQASDIIGQEIINYRHETTPPNPDPIWRRKHRSANNTGLLHVILDAIASNRSLAIALILACGVFSALFAEGRIAAVLATLVTAMASCSVLALGHRTRIKKLSQVEAMRARFENLEDRAWELRESEERYRSIAESFGDMLIMRRQDGIINYCNPAFAEYFGKSPNQLQGTDFRPLPVHSSPVQTGLGHVTQEFAFQVGAGKNTELRWFAWLDLPVRDDKEGGTLTLSVARDITSFKQAERTLDAARDKAEQANRAKSRFLAMVSHEMRTPLNGILGMSQLLEGTKLTPEQKSYLDAVSSSGRSLLRLIEEMLDLTMIEAGRFQLYKQTFDLKPLLTNVVELMSARAYAKGIGLGLFIDPSAPLQIEGDADRIRQVLLNLIGNAIKFTQKGGISIKCYVKTMPENHFARQMRLCFDIIDTGPGLCDEDKARVFNEFERVDDGKTRKSGGAGLGLAISRAIAAQMQGTLELTHTGPKGSLFSFELPVPAIANVPVDGLLNGKLIVIATANKIEAECISAQLSANGAEIKLLSSGPQLAKTLAKKNTTPYAILLDPDALLGAKRTIKNLAKQHVKSSKIIVMVDPAKRKSLPHYLDCGADAYLVRPVREDSLMAILMDEKPDKRAAIELEQVTGPSNPVQKADLADVKILLAEDNDINAMLVLATLSKAGAIVERAMDGDDAFKKFTKVNKGSKYDFVLMDMHMPIMDGLEAASRIRKWEKRKKSAKLTPIFALSADDQADTRSQALAAGMDRFLIKPIDPDVLVATILENIKP